MLVPERKNEYLVIAPKSVVCGTLVNLITGAISNRLDRDRLSRAGTNRGSCTSVGSAVVDDGCVVDKRRTEHFRRAGVRDRQVCARNVDVRR
ncbi:MAG: hypothetical protein VXW22_14705 [Pseudomonadota bacterium]|nr:hypothetical protein [Pseudomonadota bacterium]